MNPIEEIDRLAELRRNEIAELEAKNEALPSRIAAADEKASAAAEAGDMGAFDAAAVERDALKREQEYIRIRLQKLKTSPAVDPDRVMAAWKDYRAKYDPLMEKAIAEFEKTRRKMLDTYSVMVQLQTESSAVRKRFDGYVGQNPLNPVDPVVRFPARMIPLRTANSTNVALLSMGGTTLKDPDAVYYLSDYVLNTIGARPGDYYHTDSGLAKLNGVIGAGMIPD